VTHPTQATSTLPAPAILGLDLGDSYVHFCALDGDRKVLERGRVRTTPDALTKGFSGRDRCQVIMEAGSQSAWISALLTDLGYSVMVVDPRKIKLITESHCKTDARDAEILARVGLGMPELIGRAYTRRSGERAALAIIRARDLLVGERTSLICHVKGTCKAFGVRIGKVSAESFHRKALELVPEELKPALIPVFNMLASLDVQIRDLDKKLGALESKHFPVAKQVLQQVHGVGTITSVAYALTIGDPHRFKKSRDVGAYLGLCPKVRDSGDSNPQLPISKRGDAYMRRILVQAAHYILGPFGEDSDLRRYGKRIIDKGGKGARKRAAVAVARKLAVLLHRLWVSGEPYDPLRQAKATGTEVAA
jgi:transposase